MLTPIASLSIYRKLALSTNSNLYQPPRDSPLYCQAGTPAQDILFCYCVPCPQAS